MARALGPRDTVAEWPLVHPARAPVPDSRRFSDGLPPTARQSTVGHPRRRPPHRRARSVRSARRFTLARSAQRERARGAERRVRHVERAGSRGDVAFGGSRGPETRAKGPAEPRFQPQGESAARPQRFKSDTGTVRTAVCVEPRDGVLHIFMPPLAEVVDYLELCAVIEDTADELGKKIRLEGYHPPSDPRMNRLSVTPDPGVIEVNVHPAASWDELVSNTTVLYEEARQTHLRAEKFMLDGRHTGTGGGNHVVLGGATPARQPHAAPPRSLRSMVGYWLNHPALSFLFSGMFVGSTSQSPRVDEARLDSVYELDIAFRQLEWRLRPAALPRRGSSIASSAICSST